MNPLKKRLYDFRGEKLSVSEIAERTGLSPYLISSRIHAGKQGEELAAQVMSRSEAGKRARAKGLENKELKETNATMEEVAERMGISRTRVNQLEQSGLRKMRRKLEAMGITAEDIF